MSTDKLANVPDLPSVMQDGVEVHDTHFMDNPVMLRTQAQYAVDAINSLIEDVNANTAGLAAEIATRDDADEALSDQIATLRSQVSGSYSTGITARDVRIGLEAGVIERESGTLTVQRLTITADNQLGPQTKPSNWDEAEEENVVTVAGAEFSYGHNTHSVAVMASGSATFSLIANPVYQRYRTLVIGAGSTIYAVTLPAYADVAVGVEWRFVNLRTGPGGAVTVGDYVLASQDYVVILRTNVGYIVVGSGDITTVTA